MSGNSPDGFLGCYSLRPVGGSKPIVPLELSFRSLAPLLIGLVRNPVTPVTQTPTATSGALLLSLSRSIPPVAIGVSVGSGLKFLADKAYEGYGGPPIATPIKLPPRLPTWHETKVDDASAEPRANLKPGITVLQNDPDFFFKLREYIDQSESGTVIRRSRQTGPLILPAAGNNSIQITHENGSWNAYGRLVATDEELNNLEDALGYKFNDRSFLVWSLTNTPRRHFTDGYTPIDLGHQPLEWLGDAALTLMVSVDLLSGAQTTQERNKSQMQRTMNITLKEIAKTLPLETIVERQRLSATKWKLPANLVEALMFAVLHDSDRFEVAQEKFGHLLNKIQFPPLDEEAFARASEANDEKRKLGRHGLPKIPYVKMYFETIESRIGYAFKNKRLLELALIDGSINESNNRWSTNEELSWLGRSVFKFCISLQLLEHMLAGDGVVANTYRELFETEFYKTFIMQRLGFTSAISYEPTAMKAQRTTLGPATALEAILGAILLDGGYKSANTFFEKICLAPFTTWWHGFKTDPNRRRIYGLHLNAYPFPKRYQPGKPAGPVTKVHTVMPDLDGWGGFDPPESSK